MARSASARATSRPCSKRSSGSRTYAVTSEAVSLSPQAPPPGAPAYGWRPAPPPLAPNGLPLADFGSRLGAFVIDRLILGGIQVILLIPLILWWFFTFFDLMSTQMTQLETNEGFVQ